MKRLIIMIAAVVLGTGFAVEGDCIRIDPFGGTPIVGSVGNLIRGGSYLDGAAAVLLDSCATVKNHLDDFGTCPVGESCVNMSARLVRVSGEDTNCRLFADSISSWDINYRNERFTSIDNEGNEIVLTDINANYTDLDFDYMIEDVSVFNSYEHYEIKYRRGWLSLSTTKRIAFTSVEYTPPPTPSSGDGDDDGGGGGGEAGEGPVGGEGGGGEGGEGGEGGGSGGEGEVTDLCVSVTCLEGQTCDSATGACVAVVILPADLCAGVICPEGQVCQTSTGACVAVPPPPDLCANMTCPSGQTCVNGTCAAQIDLPRREVVRNPDDLTPGLDTSEGGCQFSPHAASGASGAPYLWLTVTGIALAIARRRLRRR